MSSRVCRKCGQKKELFEFRQRLLKSGRGYYRLGTCRQCERRIQKEYRINNPEKVKTALQRWERENRELNRRHSNDSYHRCFEARSRNGREWRLRNKDRVVERNRGYIDNLSDSYIRNEIKRQARQDGFILNCREIPDSLVKLKKEKIRLDRLIYPRRQK